MDVDIVCSCIEICSWVKSSDQSVTNFGWTQRNLANLPSNSRFGKLVKSCFQAPPGYTKVNVNHWNGIIAVLKEKGK